MASFAQLDSNNKVINVIHLPNSFIRDSDGNECEDIGVCYCKDCLGQDTNWKQTSFSGKFRKRFAGIGYYYNEEYDAFIPPQPSPDWEFDETNLYWISPYEETEEIAEEMSGEGVISFPETAPIPPPFPD